MIRAIIFDFDGTLSDRNRNAYDYYSGYLKQYFKDLSDIEYEAVLQDMMFYDCNGTIPIVLRAAPLMNKYGQYLPDDLPEKLAQDFLRDMYTTCVLRDETAAILKDLRGRYKLGLLSNGDSDSQHNKIAKTQTAQYFDEVIVSGDYGIHKPDKRIFEIMAEKLGVNCEECLMIGDVFSTDILGAFRAGMTPVWLCIDREKPADSYKGFRIDSISQIYDVLKKTGEYDESTYHE